MSTGEPGVVIAMARGDLVDVQFTWGRATVHVEDLAALPDLPDEQIIAGAMGDGLAYSLRLQALFLQHAYRYDPLSGLSNARIEPKPHQVYVAHRVTNKVRPRMILADEVGLGKTIEAGLILKELRARQSVERVLILCPASLQQQWQFELKSKFNEDFDIIDGAAAKYLGRGAQNPWTRRDRVISSLTFAARPPRSDQVLEADWDLVIFDEAHRVRRRYEGPNRYRATQAYELADELKDEVHGLLALTATPMQLHPFEMYSLIELVEPGLFPAYEVYEHKRSDLPSLNDVMKALMDWPARTEDERLATFDDHRQLFEDLGFSRTDVVVRLEDQQVRDRAMEELTDKHPLTGVLMRNRKSQVGGFQPRKASRTPVQPSDEEMSLYLDVTDYLRDGYNLAIAQKNQAVGFLMVLFQKILTSSSHALRESFKRRIQKLESAIEEYESQTTPKKRRRVDELRELEEDSVAVEELEDVVLDVETAEWEVETLAGFVDRLGKIRDSKAAVLLNEVVVPVLDRDPHEKILVFTSFIDTQDYLARALRHTGYSVATYNGQMTLDEKEAAVRRFRESAQVMITTEAGGEGRNFQFSHIMVNYDLPWNPMRVEQRIGRLDRIGQTRPVLIFNLALEGTVEERVLDILEHRIGLFEEAVGSLDPILGDIERDLERIVLAHLGTTEQSVEDYGIELEKRVAEARHVENVMADFILDRASLRHDKTNQLLGRTPLARHTQLRSFLTAGLEYLGGSLTEHQEGGDVVSLAPLVARSLGLDRSHRGVFDPVEALAHEDLDFFAFGHELIDKLVDHLARAEYLTAARRLNDAPSGVSLELWYALEGEGVRPSGSLIRHVVGEDLVVDSRVIDQIPALGEHVEVAAPDWLAQAVGLSRQVAIGEQQRERERVRAEDDESKRLELERAERIVTYRRRRLEDIIERDQAWIDEKQVSGSDRERRVLPARTGKLAKRRAELASLEADYEQDCAEIRARHPDVTMSVVAAGLAVGS
jgi:SNF2 family DNA or RNA helicase